MYQFIFTRFSFFFLIWHKYTYISLFSKYDSAYILMKKIPINIHDGAHTADSRGKIFFTLFFPASILDTIQ